MRFVAPIERPRHNRRARFAIANFDFEGLADASRGFQVCHRDRPLNRRCERPAGHDSGVVAVAKYAVTLSRDYPAVVGLQSDQSLFQALLALRSKRCAADEVATELYERRQSRFERRRISIEFVTVERQAGLEPQRVTRAKSDRLDIRGRARVENRLEQLPRAVVIHEQLETVFAGVSCTCSQARDSRNLSTGDAKARDVG